MLEPFIAASLVALCSITGVFFFGHNRQLAGIERYAIPTAVGVFLSLVLFELIPETLERNETWGGVAVAAGFILFYLLSYELHRYFHKYEKDDIDCDRKGAANLLLVGDAIHNVADGIILGGAFLINPTLGFAVAVGLALHEIPQEIVEFGVLIRGGYTRTQALVRNLISASTIVVGTMATIWFATSFESYLWLITGIAAGNLLFLAATDLLPRVHGNLQNYRNFWYTFISIIAGFVIMTSVLVYTHETFGHGHAHDTHEEAAHEHEDEHHHDEELR